MTHILFQAWWKGKGFKKKTSSKIYFWEEKNDLINIIQLEFEKKNIWFKDY